ncbi:MAG: hypothetical protein MH132_02235 [Hydrotalea sp.]|jgi:hypothetical protein|nr:hypothetical protein [Hydrotalea sp.]MCG9898799.1 hypothetical protein [Hydrotalea sp.]
MKVAYFLFITITAFGCDRPKAEPEKRTFDEFIFSYSEECCSYSLKFSDKDTIFMQRQFPEPKENFFTIADRKHVFRLDSFIHRIELAKFDTMYFQNNLHDGGSYKFYLKLDTAIKWTFVYGDEAPKKLYEFGDWLRSLKEKMIYTKTNRQIDFGDLKYIELPSVSPPPIIGNSR